MTIDDDTDMPIVDSVDAALFYARQGFGIIPLHAPQGERCDCGRPDCDSPAKHPWTQHGLTDASRDEQAIRAWWRRWPGANVGMVIPDGWVVVDIDSEAGLQALRQAGRELPPTAVAKTGRGYHYLYQCHGRIRPSVGLMEHVDIRGPGSYVVASPSRHISGARYQWLLPLSQADWAPPHIEALADAPPGPSERPRFDTAAALAGIPAGQRDVELFRLASKLRSADVPYEYALHLVLEAAARCTPPFPVGQARAKVDSAYQRYQPSVGFAAEPPQPNGRTGDAAPRYHLTDMGNAQRFVAQFGQRVRYCKVWGDWVIFDGARWRLDTTGQIVTLAQRVPALIYHEAGDAPTRDERAALANWARRSESAAALRAMLSIAESAVPAEPLLFDRDPWLLNVRTGTVDLRTGVLRPHQRDDFITKLIDLEYEPHAPAALWTGVLARVLPDETLRTFFHRAAGYSATGSARERCIIMLIGTGRNGKGVCLQTIRAVLADYAVRTPAETFMARRNDGIPNDVAALRGARMVFSSETNEGRRLAEATIKDLTGGEEIAARFMRGEWFSFTPAFTPWLSSNHKPVIRGTDLAIWDRIRLVPFTVRIPDDEQDPQLAEKLQAEYPGILAWIIRGAVDWYARGLGLPPAVRAATATYRGEMDTLGSFLAERCVVDPQAWVLTKDIFGAYQRWCDESREPQMSQTRFGLQLTERGFDAGRDGPYQARTRSGLRLRAENEPFSTPDRHVLGGQTDTGTIFGITNMNLPRKGVNREIESDLSEASEWTSDNDDEWAGKPG